MSEIDWTNPPPEVEEETLSGVLHDAELYSITSDPLNRTVELVVDVAHLREHFGLPESLRFVLRLHDVRSARAIRFDLWPGPAPSMERLPHETQRRLIDEYRAKGREVSVGWDEVERLVRAEEMSVLEADLLRSGDQLSLRLGGLAEDGEGPWYLLYIRARDLTVTRTDGEECDLARFGDMGEAYWDAFEARRPPGKE
jgi:hypothetical protein